MVHASKAIELMCDLLTEYIFTSDCFNKLVLTMVMALIIIILIKCIVLCGMI